MEAAMASSEQADRPGQDDEDDHGHAWWRCGKGKTRSPWVRYNVESARRSSSVVTAAVVLLRWDPTVPRATAGRWAAAAAAHREEENAWRKRISPKTLGSSGVCDMTDSNNMTFYLDHFSVHQIQALLVNHRTAVPSSYPMLHGTQVDFWFGFGSCFSHRFQVPTRSSSSFFRAPCFRQMSSKAVTLFMPLLKKLAFKGTSTLGQWTDQSCPWPITARLIVLFSWRYAE